MDHVDRTVRGRNRPAYNTLTNYSNNQLHGAEPFLGSSASQEIPLHFIEPEGSLPRKQLARHLSLF